VPEGRWKLANVSWAILGRAAYGSCVRSALPGADGLDLERLRALAYLCDDIVQVEERGTRVVAEGILRQPHDADSSSAGGFKPRLELRSISHATRFQGEACGCSGVSQERRCPLVGKPLAEVRRLTDLPAIVVAPICPPSPDGWRYTNWHWKMLGAVVREMSEQYRVDVERRSVIGFSMGGSAAWELPFYEPELFAKSPARTT
jgi:hypothetical protein